MIPIIGIIWYLINVIEFIDSLWNSFGFCRLIGEENRSYACRGFCIPEILLIKSLWYNLKFSYSLYFLKFVIKSPSFIIFRSYFFFFFLVRLHQRWCCKTSIKKVHNARLCLFLWWYQPLMIRAQMSSFIRGCKMVF